MGINLIHESGLVHALLLVIFDSILFGIKIVLAILFIIS